MTGPFSAINTRRNRFAHRAANWILNHVASREYRAFIGVAVRRGLDEMIEDRLCQCSNPCYIAKTGKVPGGACREGRPWPKVEPWFPPNSRPKAKPDPFRGAA
jgi:hypothetical protein